MLSFVLKLKGLFRRKGQKRRKKPGPEALRLQQELLETLDQWQAARTRFDSASGEEEINWTIYLMQTAITHYTCLLAKARQEGLELSLPRVEPR